MVKRKPQRRSCQLFCSATGLWGGILFSESCASKDAGFWSASAPHVSGSVSAPIDLKYSRRKSLSHDCAI